MKIFNPLKYLSLINDRLILVQLRLLHMKNAAIPQTFWCIAVPADIRAATTEGWPKQKCNAVRLLQFTEFTLAPLEINSCQQAAVVSTKDENNEDQIYKQDYRYINNRLTRIGAILWDRGCVEWPVHPKINSWYRVLIHNFFNFLVDILHLTGWIRLNNSKIKYKKG